MSDVKLLIKLPKQVYNYICKHHYIANSDMLDIRDAIIGGKPIPEHERLITETEILEFLKCPEYENCSWKNCYDCNKGRCINLNNVNKLVSIIEAEREMKE